MGDAIFARQVIAAACDVATQVLPEIDQLQGRANVVTQCQAGTVVHAVQVQQQATHRVGGAAAIVEQVCVGVVTGAVAAFGDILLKGVKQIGQQPNRQLKLQDHRGQWFKNLRPAAAVGLVAAGGQQVGAHFGQVLQALGGAGIALVGNVVGGACKPVNGGNRRPQMRRAQPGSDGEVLVMPGGCRLGG